MKILLTAVCLLSASRAVGMLQDNSFKECSIAFMSDIIDQLCPPGTTTLRLADSQYGFHTGDQADD